ncbi:MAG: hypothetical protein H8E46_12130 [FCB group bacterium]|nr:hypothetical protein [FCB group bacterium]
MAYKLKSAFRPSERKRRDEGDMEINLTPIMNLVVVLIPMLLQAMVVIKLGRIDYEPPPLAVGEAQDSGDENQDGGSDEPTTLNLVLNVADSSLQVSIFGAVEGDNYWDLPMTEAGEYDFAALQEILYKIKTEKVGAPIRTETAADPKTGEEIVKEVYKLDDAAIVRIAAGPRLDYQSLVTMLDVTRSIMVDGEEKWLFPQPVLGQLATALVAVG